jgi:hypothetical protein
MFSPFPFVNTKKYHSQRAGVKASNTALTFDVGQASSLSLPFFGTFSFSGTLLDLPW